MGGQDDKIRLRLSTERRQYRHAFHRFSQHAVGRERKVSRRGAYSNCIAHARRRRSRYVQHVDARQHEIFYEMENVPPEQHGRVLVLKKFREFFANNLCIAGESLGRRNGREYARFPRLSCWLKKSGAIALILSDGTFQINFNVSRFR